MRTSSFLGSGIVAIAVVALAVVLVVLQLGDGYARGYNNPSKRDFWVKTEALSCVVNVIDDYIKLGRNPVLVYFDLCPRVEPSAEEVIPYGSNVLPHIDIQEKEKMNDEIASFYILTTAELVCVGRLWREQALREHRNIDAVPATRVDLSLCGQRE